MGNRSNLHFKNWVFSSNPFILILLLRDRLIFISCLPAISNIKIIWIYIHFLYITYHHDFYTKWQWLKSGSNVTKCLKYTVIGLFLVLPEINFATGILGNATLCFNQIAVISLVLYIRFIGRILLLKNNSICFQTNLRLN